MNDESKKDIALGAIALGVGVALGAVLNNDATRKSLVDKGKSWINEYQSLVDRGKSWVNGYLTELS